MSDFPPPPGPASPDDLPEGVWRGEVGRDYASWGSRLGAYLIDTLVILAVNLVLRAIFGENLAIALLSIVGAMLYFALLEREEGGGQTLGKKAVGIRVAYDGAGTVSTGRAIGRYFARYVSALPCLLGYFWPIWDAKSQAFHDKLATTIVVKV
jgi:uncharacterized RDD family membrane protein YckC